MKDYREHKTLEIELDSLAGNETVKLSYLFVIEPEEKPSRHCPGCGPAPYVDQPVYQGVYDHNDQRLSKTELQEQAYAAFAIAHFRSNEKKLVANCYEEFCNPIHQGYRDLMLALHGPALERDANEFNRMMARHHAPACVGV